MTFNYLDDLISRHSGNGLLIDTNLLLLYFMGSYDPQQIGRFKRTRQFTVRDFDLIQRLMSFFKKIVTTPNILTEVSNLGGQLPESMKARFHDCLKEKIEVLTEEYCPSSMACQHPYFGRCGLTDSAIMHVTRSHYLVITDDFKLAGILARLKIDVINFNHIRQSYLLMPSP